MTLFLFLFIVLQHLSRAPLLGDRFYGIMVFAPALIGTTIAVPLAVGTRAESKNIDDRAHRQRRYERKAAHSAAFVARGRESGKTRLCKDMNRTDRT